MTTPCPGPDPHPRTTTRFAVPTGAVDCHAHVIGAPPRWTLVPERSFTAPEASEADYLAMLDALGMTYGVLVQVSAHGTDNRLLAETLARHSDRLRGVAVVDLGWPERDYVALREAGVRGLRLNVLYGGGVGFEALERYGDLARDMGWHLQFLLDARTLPEIAGRIARLPVPVIVDHMGHFPTSAGLDHPGFATLVSLVRDGAWVKISGANRNSVEEAPYRDTIPFARRLVETAPDRCVWGSDWPHVAHWKPMMNTGVLLDILADWVPDEATRHRVLVDNPARFYGFASASP